ncbi:hypothetical protein [Variovorax sp. KK3]|uniref:hypothetical protein n=1 Tax=Variovorax sp. KK3 TaxID=1855728 RepID=UPI00117E4DF0|nr:hypothetical protein [Variovorax sp. KK3]
MFTILYRCRREGLPLHPEDIEAAPVHGELRVQRKGMKRVAVLLAADRESYVVPLLDKVRLLAINDRGILLTGFEVYPTRGLKGAGPIYRQTWWCETNPNRQKPTADPTEARRRERERAARQVGTSLLRRSARRGKYDPDISS